jgi:uncharacterized protein involved in exopolysaccharide biosynthesis
MSHLSQLESRSVADQALNPFELIRMFGTHLSWWIVPMVGCALLAGVYALVAPRSWRATQGFIIRPEAAAVSEERVGKFADLSEMKTLQETILELAKSQSVVRATLEQVGPPRKSRRESWPTLVDVENFRRAIDMRPPGGAEFGKTEVFYLSVRDADRARAEALVSAWCDQLERRMQKLRAVRAQGMIAELERTVAMADNDLAAQTARLAEFEAKIGPDLAELRTLNAQIGNQGEVSQELQGIEAERRANDIRQRENVQLLHLLRAVQNDPQQLLATPVTLLQSQPAVSKLKDALVEAQLNTAGLLGSRTENHPLVIAAREREDFVRRQLHDELAAAIRGLEIDIELNVEREEALAHRWRAARERLSRLAESRAEYAALVASVENHTRLVEAARKNLADARARHAGAQGASVIARIDGVEAGVRPVGLGRLTITGMGGVAGLMAGLGIVVLFGNPPTARKAVDTAVQASFPLSSSNGAASVSSEYPWAANVKTNGKPALVTD